MKQRKTKWVEYGKLLVMALVLVWGLNSSMKVQAATTAQKEAFKQELLYIYLNQDTTTHDVSEYQISVFEFNDVYTDFIKNEGLLIYSAYPYCPDYDYTSNLLYVQTFTLQCMDANVKTRYQKMCEAIDEIRAGIEPEMTDLDKILYFHDCVVERTVYGGSGGQIYTAGGALGEGKAVCMGYAYALNLLLKLEGFEQSYARSESLKHGWTYVKLDDEWYHIDPTWDDTRSPKYGQTSRVNFLKNDAEFMTNHGTDLYALDTTEASTSTKYSTWFLRSIVGKMVFEEGYWYYYDESTDTITKANLGTGERIQLVNCSGVTGESLVDVSGNSITMTVGGETVVLTESDEMIQLAPSEEAEFAIQELENVDLSDGNNWMSGSYHFQTGAYTSDITKICLRNYVTCEPATEYEVSITNTKYNVLIRELNQEQKLLASHNLKSGSSFTSNVNTEYLAISFYTTSTADMTYDKYMALFEDGLEISISKAGEEVEEEESEEEKDDVVSIDEVNMSDFDNWMSGSYHYQTGLYTVDAAKLCLKGYVGCDKENEYFVSVSNSKYNVLIRELDENKKLLASHNLSNGSSFVTKANTEYLGISIYTTSTGSMTYDKYAELFARGLQISLSKVACEEIDRSEGAVDSIEIPLLGNVDLSDFNNWMSGAYHYQTGLYTADTHKICLKSYVRCDSGREYSVEVSNAKYNVLIRELDVDMNMLASHNLSTGSTFVTKTGTEYLAISIYTTSTASMTYDGYAELFDGGMTVAVY